MTTLVVVRKGQHVCIAADTLATFADMKEPAAHVVNHDKIIQVGDAYLGGPGQGGIEQVLRSYFGRRRVKSDFTSPLGIFETLRDMHPVLKEDYFLVAEDEPDEAQFEGGMPPLVFASPHGIFRSCAERSVVELTQFDAVGSGRDYALGAMAAVYDDLETAEAIAARGIEIAARFDLGTGMPLTKYTVELRSADAPPPPQKAATSAKVNRRARKR